MKIYKSDIISAVAVIFLLLCVYSLVVYAGEIANVQAEYATSKRGKSVFRLHNYETRIVDCYIYGNYDYFDSFDIKSRSPSHWMLRPNGLVWECY